MTSPPRSAFRTSRPLAALLRPLLVAALVVSAPAQAGKKKPRETAPTVQAADPVPPAATTDPSAWETALGEARDAGTRFDLEGLAYVITTFKIEADLSRLAGVEGAERDRLIRHLAADPRWRLIEHQGALVAFRRVEDDRGWSVPSDGYHVAAAEAWRSALRFGSWDPAAPWASSPLVSRTRATDPRVSVKAFRVGKGRDAWEAVALAWEADHLTYELFESRPQTTLERVQTELATIPSLVDIANLDATDTRGWSPPGVPNGYPTEEVGIRLHYDEGLLDVRAWARPPGRGVTWVRLYDAAGLPWEVDAVARGTREIVGWSPEPVSFYLQGVARVAGPPPAGLHGELWHLPEGSSKVRRLGVWPVTLQ